MKIIGTYKITYDSSGVVQFMNLITHLDYMQIIYPRQLTLRTAGKKMTKRIKAELLELFGENWFTDKSPLGLAMETGILKLPETQGGEHKCIIEKIKS